MSECVVQGKLGEQVSARRCEGVRACVERRAARFAPRRERSVYMQQAGLELRERWG